MKQVIISLTATLVLFWFVHRQDAVIFSTSAPLGLVDIEFAKTEIRLTQLLWNTPIHLLTTNILGNFLFMVAYSWLLYTLLLSTTFAGNNYFERATKIFTTILVIISCLGVLENVLLFFTVKGFYNLVSLNFTFWLAVLKYAFLTVCLSHIFISFILGLFYGRKR